MPLTFYKGNKSVKGSLAAFSFNSKDQAVYLQLVRQTGYNSEKHLGSFKDGARINLKFNTMELGAFLRTIRELKESKFFHTNPQKKTTINFAPYKPKDGNDFVGFGFRATVQEQGKDNETFSIPFSFEEANILEEFFKNALRHFFDAIYSEDKARAKTYAENKPKQDSRDSDAPEPVKSEDKPDDEDLF